MSWNSQQTPHHDGGNLIKGKLIVLIAMFYDIATIWLRDLKPQWGLTVEGLPICTRLGTCAYVCFFLDNFEGAGYNSLAR